MIQRLILFISLIFFFLSSAEAQDFRMYILLGYPGSGKGTFAEALKERGYKHLSTGDILREEVKKKTAIGLRYKNEIDSSSRLLPQEVIRTVVFNQLQELIEKKEKLILDGFPKTVEQAKYLDHLIESCSLGQSVRVVYIDVPLNVAFKRIEARRSCGKCGKIYNLLAAKPKITGKCDICNASLIQRACDNAESFHKRILLFNETVKHVLTYYESKKNLIKINSNKSIKDFINQANVLDETHDNI
ncbi:MAG: nucleoside monophosphate kinase [Alphaproteobacteria bacterium]|nr:nucleoside monophosphate kinase [Alphaproteobacteria bacterium]